MGLDHTSCCDSPASPTPAPAPPVSSSDIRPAAIRRPFAPATTDKEVKSARTQGIPKRAQDDTKYCVSLWNAWMSYPRPFYCNATRLRKTHPRKFSPALDTHSNCTSLFVIALAWLSLFTLLRCALDRAIELFFVCMLV